MSYDLYFDARDNAFVRDTVLDYFRERPFYRVEKGQATYGNPDTGVYFQFDVRQSSKDDHDVVFSLNYFRPSYFSLEAEKELSVFIRHFDWTVSDPQIGGMPHDSYSGEDFVSSWERSSKRTLPAFLKNQDGGRLLVLPTDELKRFWRWNFSRRDLQATAGDNVFVPRVAFVAEDTRAASFVVWTDAIPMIFPEVDYVAIYRSELAPTRLFKRAPDFSLLTWQAVLRLLDSHLSSYGGAAIPAHQFAASTNISNSIRSLPRSIYKPTPVSTDAILDKEWIDAVRSNL